MKTPSIFSRRLLIASVLLALFILCDILLFTWLIFRTLSQLEVDRVLLETRTEAQDLARRILAESGEGENADNDLLLVLVRQQEIQSYIDSELVGGELVQVVEIYDEAGNLIYRRGPQEEEGVSDLTPMLDEVLVPSSEAPPAAQGLDQLEVSEAIGKLGSLRIGISPAELGKRTAVLRRKIIQRLVWIMVATVLVLLSAYAIIWLLIARIRRAEEQAREADRLAYIGTLAAGLAHEIRNPLNSLNLNMQMLEEEIAESREMPTGRRLLGITRQEITRLERLVTDFLLYARPRPLDLEEVTPVRLLRRVEELLAGELRARGVEITVQDGCPGCRVRVDPAQMTQLLLNLTQNAVAATEESGRPARVVLAARREGGRVGFSVEDNGVGIPEQDQERIFEIFYSTRKGGTGLGLAVVQRIAQNHNGEIEVRSTPGEGTRFTLLLPLALPHREGMPARDEA